MNKGKNLIQILYEELAKGEFHKEEDIVIVDQNDPEPEGIFDEYDNRILVGQGYDGNGNDHLSYYSLDIRDVERCGNDRALVETLVRNRYPGADDMDLYMSLLQQAADDFGIPSIDLVAEKMKHKLNSVVVLMREGRYFMDFGNERFDVTPFILDHPNDFIAVRGSDFKKDSYLRYRVASMDQLED